MANEKSQNLKAYEDMKKRRKDPKTEKAIIKEGLKSRYFSGNETPMKRERTTEGFKARREAKQKEILGKIGKSVFSTLKKVANPASVITDGLSKLRNKEKKADFQKGDYSDIKMARGGRAGYKDGSKGCGKANKGKGRAYGQNS